MAAKLLSGLPADAKATVLEGVRKVRPGQAAFMCVCVCVCVYVCVCVCVYRLKPFVHCEPSSACFPSADAQGQGPRDRVGRGWLPCLRPRADCAHAGTVARGRLLSLAYLLLTASARLRSETNCTWHEWARTSGRWICC
jgi:hypothetical protein